PMRTRPISRPFSGPFRSTRLTNLRPARCSRTSGSWLRSSAPSRSKPRMRLGSTRPRPSSTSISLRAAPESCPATSCGPWLRPTLPRNGIRPRSRDSSRSAACGGADIAGDDLVEDCRQRALDLPPRKMGAELGQIRDVADVVAAARLVAVLISKRMPALLQGSDRLQDGDAVGAAAAQVVDLAHARRGEELQEQFGRIVSVDLIPHLLAAVAMNPIGLAKHRAANDVIEVAMQRHAGVLRAGEAAAAEDADGHAEVAAVFLAQRVGGELRGAEKRMEALVHRAIFGNAIAAIGVVPPRVQLAKRNLIRAIAVDFVAAGEAEGRFRRGFARRRQQVEGCAGVHVEIREWNLRRLVMRRLSCGVDDELRAGPPHQGGNAGAVAKIQIAMLVAAVLAQSADHGGGAAPGTKEPSAQIVVHAHNAPSLAAQQFGAGRADQPPRTGHKRSLHARVGGANNRLRPPANG